MWKVSPAQLPTLARRRSIALARRVEMPIRLGPAAPYVWDGKALQVAPHMDFALITHEVAHWLLCPRKRRTVPEYGLGTVFTFAWWESDAPRAPRILSRDAAEHEECLALMLGILYQGVLGLPWRESIDPFHRSVCPGTGACDERYLRSLATFETTYDDYADELRGRKLVDPDDQLPVRGRLRSWRPAAEIR
jgi:hypothetical protein